MIRMLFALLFVVVFLILSLPVQGIFWLLRKRHRAWVDMASLRIVQWAFKVVIFISGARPDIKGLDNIPTDRPVLFIGNHQSFFDVIITYSRMPRLTGYISKKQHEKIPLLPIWMGRLYCLFLDRDNPREGLKTILQAIDYVKEGVSIFIFPEGGRSKDGAFHDFKAGSFKIATKTGCPIIPVAITGTEEVMEKHFPRLKKAPVQVTFGAPVELDTLTPEEKKHISDYVHHIMEGMLQEQRGEKFFMVHSEK